MDLRFYRGLKTEIATSKPRHWICCRWRKGRIADRQNALTLAEARWRKVASLRVLLSTLHSAKVESRKLQDDQYSGLCQTREGEEIEQKVTENPWIIYPHHTWKHLFDLLSAAVVLYFCVKTPYLLGFHNGETDFQIYDFIFDLVMLIDMILTFCTAYVDNFKVIDNRWLIAKRYFTSCFFPDLFALFPLYVLRPGLMWLRIFRLLHVGRIATVIKHEDASPGQGCLSKCVDWHTKRHIADMTRILLYLFLTCHGLACAWNYISENEGVPYTENWKSGMPLTLKQAYVVSLYWVVVTFSTIGFGDVVPRTSPEYAFAMMVETLGILFYCYLISRVTSIIRSLDVRRKLRDELKDALELTLIAIERGRRHCRLPSALVRAFRSHFAHVWRKDHSHLVNNSEFFMRLPPKEREELILLLFHDDVTRFAVFFVNCEEQFKFQVVMSMSPRKLEADQCLIEPFTPVRELFFINLGSVAVHNSAGSAFIRLTTGSYCGEDYLLFRDLPTVWYRAEQNRVELFCLKKTEFANLMSCYVAASHAVSRRAVVRRRYFRAVAGEEIAIGRDMKPYKSFANGSESAGSIFDRVAANFHTFTPQDESELAFLLSHANTDSDLYRSKVSEDFQAISLTLRRMQRYLDQLAQQASKLQSRYESDLQSIATAIQALSSGQSASVVLSDLPN